ncbi:hypothetical protein G3I59_09560 [Amycolatopsis rubida]|uniref:Uncharacterized protein n=1 Tax=Amycolatopsis rubida TaxID=112413 RepID=A0ABX0BSP5_9PSEU|nr:MULTISPECIES: hypothetical protein [Amycolatopsis]MYW90845.1 hypothetical protein [Amycolatopsis rubida]NEC55828.1 hypothetical protein [Amycolatopsis rubida]
MILAKRASEQTGAVHQEFTDRERSTTAAKRSGCERLRSAGGDIAFSSKPVPGPVIGTGELERQEGMPNAPSQEEIPAW